MSLIFFLAAKTSGLKTLKSYDTQENRSYPLIRRTQTAVVTIFRIRAMNSFGFYFYRAKNLGFPPVSKLVYDLVTNTACSSFDVAQVLELGPHLCMAFPGFKHSVGF